MILKSFLGFIKFAYPGNGTANDINTLIFILLIILFLIVAIPFLAIGIRSYFIKHLQHNNENNENFTKDIDVFDDLDYFQI